MAKTATALPTADTASATGRFLSDAQPMNPYPNAESRLSIDRQSVPVLVDRPRSVANVTR
jgi:hypothetical protein